MKSLHLTAVILPMAILAACGGGNGRTVTALETEPLPAFPIANTEQAIALVGGQSLRPANRDEVESTLIQIATEADTLLFSDIASPIVNPRDSETVDCTRNGFCTGTFGEGSNAHRVRYKAERTPIQPAKINGIDLVEYAERYATVMTRSGVHLMQASGLGNIAHVNLVHRSYGGWLEHSAFTIRLEGFKHAASGLNDLYYVSHSFGKSSARNPGTSATWEGVMVGTTKDYSHIVQGDATIEYAMDTPNAVSITFDNIKNFNTNTDAATTRIDWPSVPLENGVFRAVDESVRGHFYGNNHEEVGGVFDKNRIVGSFGSLRTNP